MFLSELTADQKVSFLALATRMVMADGEVLDDEKKLLDALQEEMGGDIVVPAEQIFGNTNLAVFDSRRAKMVVALELMGLALSDENFASNEAEVFHNICGDLGLAESDMLAIEEWAKKKAAGTSDRELAAAATDLL